jgi:hypothetical protein
MSITLLTQRRVVLDQEVRELTLAVIGLTVMGFALLLGICVVAMAGLPAFGFIW